MLALAVGGPVLKRLAVFTRPVVSRLVPSGARAHASSTKAAPTIEIWFVEGSGKDVKVLAREGESLLEVAHRNGVDMEGACEASVACSTCHVILERDVFESLSEASEKEEDMLDQAPGLSMTSRLGCQVIVTPLFHGRKVRLPSVTRNFYVDGHRPKPH